MACCCYPQAIDDLIEGSAAIVESFNPGFGAENRLFGAKKRRHFTKTGSGQG